MKTIAVDPRVWGAAGWHILHRMSFAIHNVHDATRFFNSIETILPCPKCSRNLKEHFNNLPLPKNKAAFPEWVWKLHNRVSTSIDPKSPQFPYDEVVVLYKKYSQSQNQKNKEDDFVQIEAVFLLALVQTHPGARWITEAHANALFAFMTVYVSTFPVAKKCTVTIDSVRSKVAFRKLIKTITNIDTNHNKALPECSV